MLLVLLLLETRLSIIILTSSWVLISDVVMIDVTFMHAYDGVLIINRGENEPPNVVFGVRMNV